MFLRYFITRGWPQSVFLKQRATRPLVFDFGAPPRPGVVPRQPPAGCAWLRLLASSGRCS
jgi:hypothetical protein